MIAGCIAIKNHVLQKNLKKVMTNMLLAAWGDYILSEEGYEDNKLVQAHLAGVKVKQEIKESKK